MRFLIDTVSYWIVGGNDNGGQPGFGVTRTTRRAGVVYLASDHDYVLGKRFYSLNFNLTDDGTAAYCPSRNIVPYIINATCIHVPVPPLFLKHPNGTASVPGTCCCCPLHDFPVSNTRACLKIRGMCTRSVRGAPRQWASVQLQLVPIRSGDWDGTIRGLGCVGDS